MQKRIELKAEFSKAERAILFPGGCLEFLAKIPDQTFQLIVTSPPYNLGKEYERRLAVDEYVSQQEQVIRSCVRVLKSSGSLCWQVGNYVEDSSIIPLDSLLFPIFNRLGLKLRNRIIWHFEHGLHCSRRFSGRYETILWFTKSEDYFFNLDAVRVPQKYPGKKYFKGPKAGEYSCNPLGKNPGDVWIVPNVKSNHVEKTSHPCQFPVELIERLVLPLTQPDDWVFDPFLGTGTSIIAAIRNDRCGAGSEVFPEYIKLACDRIERAIDGTLPVRPMMRPVFDPRDAGTNLTTAPWLKERKVENLLPLREKRARYKGRR